MTTRIYIADYQGGALEGDFARVDIDLAGDVDALKQRTKASRSRLLHDVDLGDMTVFGPWAVKPRRIEVPPAPSSGPIFLSALRQSASFR